MKLLRITLLMATMALVSQKEATSGVLEITAGEPGLEAYAFTFGN